MAGTLGHYAKGQDNRKFHMEMDNVASAREAYASQTYRGVTGSQPAYIQTVSAKVDASRGSVLSLDSRFAEQQSDVLPLTEAHLCSYEECMRFHSGTGGAGRESQLPGTPLKNLFFYTVLVLLVVWILVYAILNKLDFL